MKPRAAKITPFLWFAADVGRAIKFYSAIFSRVKILSVSRNGRQIRAATLRLNGLELTLFNGGPHYQLTPAVSLMVQCRTQQEVDYYWKRLTKGGQESRCGWLVDRFGLSWQIVPDVLFDLLQDKDAAKADRAFDAMMTMRKLDIPSLKAAHAGR